MIGGKCVDSSSVDMRLMLCLLPVLLMVAITGNGNIQFALDM
jgi:hypothetical protein